MQLAVVSDTHDNWPALDACLTAVAARGIDVLLHCGDMCAPLTLGHLLDGFGGTVHTVLGNVDGDPFLMATRFRRDNLHQHGAALARIDIGERAIAVHHYPELARGLAATGDYDAVFYGHDHTAHEEWLTVGEREVLLANPGTLAAMGRPLTYAIYDGDSHRWEQVDLIVPAP